MSADRTPLQLARSFGWYLIIGGAKTAASYGTYALLVQVGSTPQMALLYAHILVTVLGYRSHARLAFGVGGWNGFWWYVLITTVIYATNVVALALLLAWHCGPLIAQLLCQLVTIPLGFFLLRRVLRPT